MFLLGVFVVIISIGLFVAAALKWIYQQIQIVEGITPLRKKNHSVLIVCALAWVWFLIGIKISQF